MIAKRVLRVQGFASLGTEVWELPATTAPVVHICIVPGNPGSAGYYGAFMRYLHRAFEGKAIVSSVASLGFHTQDSDLHKDFRTYTLQEQSQHKAAYLQQHVFPAHDLPVIVMGHSIGITMAMQAVRQCERHRTYARTQRDGKSQPVNEGSSVPNGHHDHSNRVIQLIGLMPFVHTSPQQPVQRRLRFLASIRGLLGTAAILLSLLPTAIRKQLAIVGGGKMDSECVDVTAALIRPDVVKVAFTLAHHEFHDLDSEASDGWEDFEHFASQSRLAVLAAPDDAWWPQAHHARACNLLPQHLIELQPQQDHAFCTQPERSKGAAVACERWIRTALAERAACSSEAAGARGAAERSATRATPAWRPNRAFTAAELRCSAPVWARRGRIRPAKIMHRCAAVAAARARSTACVLHY
eukprot:jgi/Ulvmu1/11746/UM008_0159.1